MAIRRDRVKMFAHVYSSFWYVGVSSILLSQQVSATSAWVWVFSSPLWGKCFSQENQNWKRMWFQSCKKNHSWAAVSWLLVTHNLLHLIRTQCIAHDLLMIVPWPHKHAFWQLFIMQWGGCRKSLTAFFYVIITFINMLLLKWRN